MNNQALSSDNYHRITLQPVFFKGWLTYFSINTDIYDCTFCSKTAYNKFIAEDQEALPSLVCAITGKFMISGGMAGSWLVHSTPV